MNGTGPTDAAIFAARQAAAMLAAAMLYAIYGRKR